MNTPPLDRQTVADTPADINRPHWLHIYPAAQWHDGIVIVGASHALRALSTALLDAAIRGEAVAAGYTNDGEGYWIEVLRVDDLADRADIQCHYVDKIAGGPIFGGGLPPDLRRRLAAAHERQT